MRNICFAGMFNCVSALNSQFGKFIILFCKLPRGINFLSRSNRLHGVPINQNSGQRFSAASKKGRAWSMLVIGFWPGYEDLGESLLSSLGHSRLFVMVEARGTPGESWLQERRPSGAPPLDIRPHFLQQSKGHPVCVKHMICLQLIMVD